MQNEELQSKMQRLYTILSEKWTPTPLDAHSWVFGHVSGWVPLSCYAEINPEMEAFLFRAIIQLPVEPAYRERVAEYITRVNYPLPIGNWALDLDSGDVRWKSGLYFGECDLSDMLIRHVIESSLFFIYENVFGIANLMVGGTMEEALATIGQDHGQGITSSMKQPG